MFTTVINLVIILIEGKEEKKRLFLFPCYVHTKPFSLHDDFYLEMSTV